MAAFGLAFGLPVAVIGVLLVRLAAPSLPPGDAAVIVSVPVMLVFLAARLIGAVVADIDEPETGAERSPFALRLLVAVFAVGIPTLIIAAGAAAIYAQIGISIAEAWALRVARIITQFMMLAGSLIGLWACRAARNASRSYSTQRWR